LLIVNFDFQVTLLIARCLREAGVYCGRGTDGSRTRTQHADRAGEPPSISRAGLAICIPGKITSDKLDLLRKVDAIDLDEIRKAGLYE
jgi:hypothetical protein